MDGGADDIECVVSTGIAKAIYPTYIKRMPILAIQPYGNITNVIFLFLIEHLHIYFIYTLCYNVYIATEFVRSLGKGQHLRPGAEVCTFWRLK